MDDDVIHRVRVCRNCGNQPKTTSQHVAPKHKAKFRTSSGPVHDPGGAVGYGS